MVFKRPPGERFSRSSELAKGDILMVFKRPPGGPLFFEKRGGGGRLEGWATFGNNTGLEFSGEKYDLTANP